MISESTKALRQEEDVRHRELVRIYYETGSEDSLGPLLAELRPSLMRFLTSKGLRKPELLEEIAQLALVDVLAGIRKRQPDSSPGSKFFNWAATVAWSALLKYRRNELRHGQPSAPGGVENPFLLLPDSATSFPPDDTVGNAESEARAIELIKAATQAVMGLDPNARNAVILHFYHGLTHTAAAEQMGISVNRFTTRLERGLDALRGWAAQQSDPTAEIYVALRKVNTGDLFRDPPPKLNWYAKKKAARQRAEE